MRRTRTETVETFELYTFADGTRLAWVTWEITSDGYGVVARRAISVRER